MVISGANSEEGQDWFGKQPKAERKNDKPIPETTTEIGLPPVPEVDSPEKLSTDPIVPLIIPNDAELGFGWPFAELSEDKEVQFVPDFTRYARSPLPHQESAVRWLLGHARRR